MVPCLQRVSPLLGITFPRPKKTRRLGAGNDPFEPSEPAQPHSH